MYIKFIIYLDLVFLITPERATPRLFGKCNDYLDLVLFITPERATPRLFGKLTDYLDPVLEMHWLADDYLDSRVLKKRMAAAGSLKLMPRAKAGRK